MPNDKFDLNALVRKQTSIKHKLTSISNYVNGIKPELENGEDVLEDLYFYIELELRVTKAELILLEFEQIQTAIEAGIQEKEIQMHVEQRELFQVIIIYRMQSSCIENQDAMRVNIQVHQWKLHEQGVMLRS